MRSRSPIGMPVGQSTIGPPSLIAQIYALKGVLSIETSIIMESLKYNYRLAKIISPPTS